MARFAVAQGPNYEIGVEYTASNGRATHVYCVNSTGADIHAMAILTNSTVHGQRFPQGDLRVALPSNVVTVSFNAQGEVTITGLARTEVRVPA